MSQEKDEVRRLLDILQTFMRMLAVSNREVERRLDLKHGTISRFFGGQIEAKIELVLSVARALGLEYEELFAFAYPERLSRKPESDSARKIRSMLEDLRPVGSRRPVRAEEPAGAVSLNRAELVEDVRQAVREIMADMGVGKGERPRAGRGGRG